jgi:hypothetical protein
MRPAPASRGFGPLGRARGYPAPPGTSRAWAGGTAGAGNAPRRSRRPLVALASRMVPGAAEAKDLQSLRSLKTLRSLRSQGPGVLTARTGTAATIFFVRFFAGCGSRKSAPVSHGKPFFAFFCFFCSVPGFDRDLNRRAFLSRAHGCRSGDLARCDRLLAKRVVGAAENAGLSL